MTNILVLNSGSLFRFAKIFRFCIFTLPLIFEKVSNKQKIFFFSVNTKNISFRELKTSEFSLVLRTRENSDVFNTLDEINLVFTSKE